MQPISGHPISDIGTSDIVSDIDSDLNPDIGLPDIVSDIASDADIGNVTAGP